MQIKGLHKALAVVLQFICLVHSATDTYVTDACSIFATDFPQFTLFPNESSYTIVNQDYFTAEEWLGPACIFTPTSPEVMSYAIRTVRDHNVIFALRGGGWMPVPGAANINSSGILLSTVNLTGMELSSDQSHVSVYSGESWESLYGYLEPYGLSVVGSRVGVPGVSGFVLGGGMSFFSNEFGWSSANVVGYELILACGTIVYATSSNDYSDLFWALRGGGNNFGLVTKVDIKTLKIPQVAVGKLTYGSGLRDAFIGSLFNFSQTGLLDPHSCVLPTISYIPAEGPNITYSSVLFSSTNDTSPSSLQDFLPPAMAAQSNTFSVRTMANYSAESDQGMDQVHGQNFRFHGFSIIADLEAMLLIHDTFFRIVQEQGPNIPGFVSTLVMNAVSKSYITTGRGLDPAGDPMGLDAESAPYFLCEELLSWSSESDVMTIEQMFEDINSELQSKLGDVLVPYLHLNNAGNGQDVFRSYNSTNLVRLQSISKKYDPEGLYSHRLVGGFKLFE